MNFDEDSTYIKSRKTPIQGNEEPRVSRIQDITMNEATPEVDREIEDPLEPVDRPREKNSHKRKHACDRELIQDAERYGIPEEEHR